MIEVLFFSLAFSVLLIVWFFAIYELVTRKSRASLVAKAFLEVELPDLSVVKAEKPSKRLRKTKDRQVVWLFAGRSQSLDIWLSVEPYCSLLYLSGYGFIGWNEKLITVYRHDASDDAFTGFPFVFNVKDGQIKKRLN